MTTSAANTSAHPNHVSTQPVATVFIKRVGQHEVPAHQIRRRGRAAIHDRGADPSPACFAFKAVGGHDPSDPLTADPKALLG